MNTANAIPIGTAVCRSRLPRFGASLPAGDFR